MERRDTFEAVADLYGEVRQGYPAALYDDLAALAGLGPGTRVLEVGCGAGQATRDLAARAGSVVALDPGQRLVAEARRHVTGANVSFVVSSFEDYEPEPGAFDLVASAQAWHWVDPAIGFRKAAAALSRTGSIAIFGHVPVPPGGAVGEAWRVAFERVLPGAWGQPSPEALYRPTGPLAGMIEGSGLFGPAAHRDYRWVWRLDPDTLARYLRTDSTYHVLPEPQRFALFDAMAAAVADHGGLLDAEWETHLYVAARG